MVGAILTIGNEIVSGDVANTNATWLAQRLESIGVRVVLTVAVPDEIDTIAALVKREHGLVDRMIVTGGLGGTPDDLTREAIAAAFGVGQEEVPALAADLRARFPRHPDYAARWAFLPAGSRPLVNPKGGAPGFLIANVWVLPGLPSEMEAMFDHYVGELRGAGTIVAWRSAYKTREGRLVPALSDGGARGRDRAEVDRRGGARRGGRLDRTGARRGGRARPLAWEDGAARSNRDLSRRPERRSA